MLKKIFENKQTKTYLIYGLLFIVTIALLIIFIKGTPLDDFVTVMENRTFDLRQTILVNSKYKKANQDIVIINIDDASYEYLFDLYGEWPIPRDVYAKLIYFIEAQHPQAMAFDLMFVKSMKSKLQADMALTKAIKSFDNVYTAMNLDDQAFDVRKPERLPNSLSVNVKNESKVNFLNFTNCRTLLPQILHGTKNIGMINVSRSDDGILRKMPPVMTYQGTYYPHMALLVGLKYLKNEGISESRDFFIDKQSNLKLNKRTIPLDEDGGAILNWYGPSNTTFQEVPFYKVVKAMNGDKNALNYSFKNKIVYIGTSALSLYDAKSVPVDKLYPGVEVHATFINNLIDNSFIKRVNVSVDIIISILLALAVGIVVMKTSSTYIALVTAIATTVGYIIISYYIMKFFNIWIGIILPVTFILLMFVIAYIVKYILKSRDFEHQYKLATTDGLTELFNHRYFQEQMIMQIANCKRYNSHFSLILIDIDHFKKFNDVYGHQSGDAVLRQVALKLKKNVRATDIVCRYGGEEMSIILPNTEKDEAIITAQKLCQTVAEKPFKLANDQESKVTISLGVSTFPQDGEAPSQIIENADKRLYVAKENGRNQVGY